jgi:DnaK suppressor protein
MVPLRQTQLREMLEEHCRVLHRQVLRRIRVLRDGDRVDPSGPVTNFSDDPAHEDIDFALAQMQAETRDKIHAALERLTSCEYGICEGCHQEIPMPRLGALPFATRCRGCQERAEEVALRARRRSPGFARL